MGADQLAQSALFREGPITSFDGEFAFLSNFHLGPVLPEGPWWTPELAPVGGFASVEHAFQAAKVEPATPGFSEHYQRIAEAAKADGSPSPGRAKRLGSARAFADAGATLRRDWDHGTKVLVMLACLRAKFAPTNPGTRPSPHSDAAEYPPPRPELDSKLMATSPRVLVEGNTWGDTYWGVCRGSGKNMLGRLLMLVRAELLCAAASGLRPEELR